MDNTQMELERLISSQNSLRVLKILSKQNVPISLRQLARTARLSTSSAELAVKRILPSRAVTRAKLKNRAVFSLDRSSELVQAILKILDILEQQRSAFIDSLSARAQASLKFMDEANAAIATARRSMISKLRDE